MCRGVFHSSYCRHFRNRDQSDVKIHLKNNFNFIQAHRKFPPLLCVIWNNNFFYISRNIDRLQRTKNHYPLYIRVYQKLTLLYQKRSTERFHSSSCTRTPFWEVNRDFTIIIGGSSIHRWLEIHEIQPRCVVTVMMIR